MNTRLKEEDVAESSTSPTDALSRAPNLEPASDGQAKQRTQMHCSSCSCKAPVEQETVGTSPNVPHTVRWYVVSKGRQVGVFEGWHAAQHLVSGVSGACFQRHPSKAAAEAAFEEAKLADRVSILF